VNKRKILNLSNFDLIPKLFVNDFEKWYFDSKAPKNGLTCGQRTKERVIICVIEENKFRKCKG